MSDKKQAGKPEDKKGKTEEKKEESKILTPVGVRIEEMGDNLQWEYQDKTEDKPTPLLPYCLHVKNLTDEKLYGVDLFNYNHEKQNKVAYSCTNGVAYNMFLRFLSSLNEVKEEIVIMRFIAVCDYPKFKSKQLRTCLDVIYEEPNGRKVTMPKELSIHLDAYQQQSDIIQVALSGKSTIKIFNQLQLRLAYLMPEAEMHITIFPQKIDDSVK